MPWSLAVGAGAGLLSALHCASMCGPLAASQGRSAAPAAALIQYQLGRTIGYGLIGGLAGGTGRALSAAGGPLIGVLFSWSLAGGLLLLAARLWRAERAPAAAPLPFGRRRRPWVARLVATLRPGPLGMGALTSLLPCGALWAALGLAAGSGAARAGALVMIGFAGTTSIGLVASGWLGGWLRRRSTASRRVLAVVLVAGAIISAMRPVGSLRAPGHAPPCHRASTGISS
jgi:uncharacterized protein